MNSYTIYSLHPNHYKIPDLIAIKEGFNFQALLFGFLWALYKRIWWLAALIMMFNFLLSGLNDHMGQMELISLQFISNIALGMFANDLYRWHLTKKGYFLVDIVHSETALAAKYRLVDFLI